VKSSRNTYRNGEQDHGQLNSIVGLILLQESRQFSSRRLAGGRPKPFLCLSLSCNTFRSTQSPRYQHPVALVVTPLIQTRKCTRKSIHSMYAHHITYEFQSIEITAFGLKAIFLPPETLEAASKEGRNLLKEISECQWDIVLLSAQRLVSTLFFRMRSSEKTLSSSELTRGMYWFHGERTFARPPIKFLSFDAASLPIQHSFPSVQQIHQVPNLNRVANS